LVEPSVRGENRYGPVVASRRCEHDVIKASLIGGERFLVVLNPSGILGPHRASKSFL
jgi:hypothetical protein